MASAVKTREELIKALERYFEAYYDVNKASEDADPLRLRCDLHVNNQKYFLFKKKFRNGQGRDRRSCSSGRLCAHDTFPCSSAGFGAKGDLPVADQCASCTAAVFHMCQFPAESRDNEVFQSGYAALYHERPFRISHGSQDHR